MTALITQSPGLPAPHEYAARLDSRLPDAAPTVAPVRILLVGIAVATSLVFLWVCAYSDLPNYYFQ